ncbi:tyrosine-type recombinase/integrase [Azospirillum doebereinerae]|uniref:tyrosine-type recombinase/integrase n=1 Tax=Azospirillum doebereinerae TaxID=92933 RepID=UPI001FD627E2|nr:tyrosine-type recombinase/integrase [Azospirillum doebereinerae]
MYDRNGYFSWRDPRNGKEHGLGRDKRSAVAQAIEANHKIEKTPERRTLVDRLEEGNDSKVTDFCDIFEKTAASRHEAGKLSLNSMKAVRQRTRLVRNKWGSRRIDAISTRDVAEYLHQWEEQGKPRMAQAMRSFLRDLFAAALAKGWVATNPVNATKVVDAEVRRSRLTLDDFRAIHAVALKEFSPWLVRAMELALVTGQRREDIISMGPAHIRDGRLWLIQGKTKTKISIPLDLRLDAVGWSIGDVIGRCRDASLSKHLIHHSKPIAQTKPGDPVRPATLTRTFAAARDLAGIKWEKGATPPSFHELRSLAARLYSTQGVDAQALLGHKSAEMTARYRDSRGAEWIEVRLSVIERASENIETSPSSY